MSEDGKIQLSRSELKEFDGKENRPAYIAYKGRVYDVSSSRLWMQGIHMGSHTAGIDLTASLENAPHGEDVFSRYPVVGVLTPDEQQRETPLRTLKRLAPHPMIVHFPIAYSLIVPMLSFLYLLTGDASFESASYYVMAVGFLVAPVCTLSGFMSWKITYRGKWSEDFRRKILFSTLLVLVITVCFLWRFADPSILVSRTGLSYVYIALQTSFIPIVSILGHTGGKIVYP